MQCRGESAEHVQLDQCGAIVSVALHHTGLTLRRTCGHAQRCDIRLLHGVQPDDLLGGRQVSLRAAPCAGLRAVPGRRRRVGEYLAERRGHGRQIGIADDARIQDANDLLASRVAQAKRIDGVRLRERWPRGRVVNGQLCVVLCAVTVQNVARMAPPECSASSRLVV